MPIGCTVVRLCGLVRVHACTGRDAAYLFSSIHRVLSQNNLRSGVRLLHRHVEALAPVAAVGASLPPLGLWGTCRDFFCHLLHDDEPKLTTDWKQNGPHGNRHLGGLTHEHYAYAGGMLAEPQCWRQHAVLIRCLRGRLCASWTRNGSMKGCLGSGCFRCLLMPSSTC